MRPNRPHFATLNAFGGTLEERSTAYEGYQSYCGRYRLDGPVIKVDVELSLFPNWIGQSRLFTIVLSGDRLKLHAGGPYTEWERLK